MDRRQLVTLVQAAARVTACTDIVVIGAASLLAVVEHPDDALLADRHADLFAREHPELGPSIEAALGPGSMYHDEHGVCARAVGPMTPLAPSGWLERLVRLDAGDRATGWCMHAPDLVLAKLAVGRGKDVDFADAAIASGVVKRKPLELLTGSMPLDEEQRAAIRRLLERL